MSEEKFVNKTNCPASISVARNRSLEESSIFFPGTLHVFERETVNQGFLREKRRLFFFLGGGEGGGNKFSYPWNLLVGKIRYANEVQVFVVSIHGFLWDGSVLGVLLANPMSNSIAHNLASLPMLIVLDSPKN